ncbi:hypothetical protein NBT05_17810 [Aquimarina sp. ERC-38]|uniref:hypothetical protein n=1 Tax=Aquimarina sp. ERC-38 TaxID=2949996 RepID=UPI002246EED7|nr:hypothetical protein [Aquimarina sp. ERC-38]UZO80781.1 hypothetical protein NBT05_17810 [Aquimarina sp. ERC-38]
MKNFKTSAIILLVSILPFFTSCSDDNDDLVVTEEESEFDGNLIVTESGAGDNRNVVLNADNIEENSVLVKVRFATTTENMRRLYITRDVANSGIEVYDLNNKTEGIEIDDKADGSVDLKGDDKKEFEFQIRLDKPLLSNGTVEYTLWTTTGRGDFRDVSKRNALGAEVVGTVTLEYGEAVNSTSGLKTFEATMLAAPLLDGSSNTFISLFNETVYKISDGEEFAALWDFGYYYGNTGKASLASASNFPALFDTNGDGEPDSAISALTGVPQEELNTFFFGASNLSFEEFEAISTGDELNGIGPLTRERINNLEEGQIVEFIDSYGHKGLILVLNVNGTFGNDGAITILVKVQV